MENITKENYVLSEKIKLTNVNKIFNVRRQTIYALKDICFAVNEGELVSIMGPSGCGKSTIIRIIDDIIRPSSGTAAIEGKNVNVKENREIIKKIGFIFQEPNLLPWLTVRQNAQMPLKVFGLKGSEWENYTDELINMVELSEYASAYPLEISGGMMQRAGVIRALVHKPEILLMDEPFGSLDEINREALDFELLDIWQKMKKTIVFITHNVHEAVMLSSRVIVMGTNPGRILDEIKIDIPYPRNPDMFLLPEFKDYEEKITNLIGELDISKII